MTSPYTTRRTLLLGTVAAGLAIATRAPHALRRNQRQSNGLRLHATTEELMPDIALPDVSG